MAKKMHARSSGLSRGRLSRESCREKGFSLVEVLVASMLLLILLVSAYGIWIGLQRSYNFTEEDLQAQQEARAAMNEMVELIRTSREPEIVVSDELDLVIVRAEKNALVCWSDVDRDAGHTLELVRFRVNTDEHTLYRDTSTVADLSFSSGTTQTRLVGAWVTNDDDTGNELFTYIGMNGLALPMTLGTASDPSHVIDPTKIREVHINLKVDVIMGSRPEYHVLSSVVHPRNLRNR